MLWLGNRTDVYCHQKKEELVIKTLTKFFSNFFSEKRLLLLQQSFFLLVDIFYK